MCHGETFNLKQVAQHLDLHYMTVYRYVRTGRLPARQDGNVWLVDGADLAAFAGTADHEEPRTSVDWTDRLRGRLVDGDDAGAWSTIESALAGGRSPDDILEMIGDAVRRSGEAFDHVAGSYLAVGSAQRALAVLESRFRPRGRTRGTVVLGAPGAEGHGFALSILGTKLRLRNLGVLDLGTGVPAAAFVDAGCRARALLAVGLGITTAEHLEETSSVIAAVRRDLSDAPIVLGGQAVRNPEVADLLGADAWAPDFDGMLTHLEQLAPRPRRRRELAPKMTQL